MKYDTSVSRRREPKHPIASVDNALKLLLMFREQPSLRVSDVTTSLGVALSTAHRLMAMLEHHGLVEQEPATKAYRSGPVLTELALKILGRMDLQTLVNPHLERLAAAANETAHFLVLDSTDTLFVAGVECSRPVRTTLRIGDRRPAHCTSSGKVLLALLPESELQSRYEGYRFTPCTSHSITSLGALERELELVREQGYGLSIGESETEIAAISVAIKAPDGQALGAFSVSMPMTRYEEQALLRLSTVIKQSALDAASSLAQAVATTTATR